MMKKLLLIISILAFAMLSHGQNVKGKVSFSFKPKNDSITIAIVCHSGSFSPDASSLYKIIRIKSGIFDLQLQPGTYICRFLHPEIAITDIPLVIEDSDSKVGFDVTLEKSSLPSELQKVQLRVWPPKGKSKIISLAKTGKKWTVPQSSALPNAIRSYVFWVNSSQYFHRSIYPTHLNLGLFYYENTFQGEEIHFSEDEYFQSKKSRIVFTSSGFDLEHFYQLFTKIEEVYERNYILQLSLDNSSRTQYYYRASSLFEKIIEEEDSYFSQIVIEPYLYLIEDHHPINLQMRSLSREEITKLKQTEAYENMIAKKLDLLKLVDVKSPILSGSFLNAFRDYFFSNRTPSKYIEYNIPFGFFLQLEYYFQQHTPSYYAKGNMLIRDIYQLKRENPNKTLQLISAFEDEYADHPSFKNGSLEKTKTDLLRSQGSVAPNFELVSLNGESLRLSDYKGKYVFLDFWGSWCAPCMIELPNIKNLSETISNEKLIVVGVACNDKKEKVERVIQDNDLKYKNAMANDKIINDYGISKYPTTYLIDPNGIIIGKDLRGENLVGRINTILYK